MKSEYVHDILCDIEEQKPLTVIISTGDNDYFLDLSNGSFDVNTMKDLLMFTGDDGTVWIDTNKIESIKI